MKLDIGFGLDNAPWPAFVVDSSCNIRHANEASVNTFGAVMDGEPALLSSIWSQEMDLTPEQFLAKIERSSSPMMQLKFRVKGGETARFNSYVCSLHHDGQKYFLFQVMRDASVLGGSGDMVYDSAEAVQRKFESGDTVLRTGAFSFEASAAQRQKLECALQLARTVSLDFNNALTSILGHTSLVLSKVEPNHPWRHSLMAVERAAQKAAEIAQDLAAFSRHEKDAHAQTPGNLNTVLSRAVESFQQPGSPRIIWTFHLEKRLFTANFDEAKMQQAFTKILENSVEAIGPEGRISVRSHNQSL